MGYTLTPHKLGDPSLFHSSNFLHQPILLFHYPSHTNTRARKAQRPVWLWERRPIEPIYNHDLRVPHHGSTVEFKRIVVSSRYPDSVAAQRQGVVKCSNRCISEMNIGAREHGDMKTYKLTARGGESLQALKTVKRYLGSEDNS